MPTKWLAPFRAGPGVGGANPYVIHQELQDVMLDLAGITRVEAELKEALVRSPPSAPVPPQSRSRVTVSTTRGGTLPLTRATCGSSGKPPTLAALERQESRGGHTRDDLPMTGPYWSGLNVVVELKPLPAGPDGSGLAVRHQPSPKPPPELAKLVEYIHELRPDSGPAQ